MTDAKQTVDALAAFFDALPARLVRPLRTSQTAVHVHRAVHTHGWAPDALAKHCAAHTAGLVNADAVVRHRLEHASDHPAPTRKLIVRNRHRGCCEGGLIYDETTIPPTVTRCDGTPPDDGDTR